VQVRKKRIISRQYRVARGGTNRDQCANISISNEWLEGGTTQL